MGDGFRSVTVVWGKGDAGDWERVEVAGGSIMSIPSRRKLKATGGEKRDRIESY